MELFAKARAALAAKQYASAVELFGRVLQAEPGMNWAWYWLGDAHAGLGQLDQAVADYTKVIEMFEKLRETPYYAYLARGLAWQRQGETEKAKADLGVALPVMIDALRHPDGGKTFDYADMPTDVRTALEKLTPAQRRENMIGRLRQATGQGFEYRADMTPQQLEELIRQGEGWWSQHVQEYPPASQPAGATGP